MTEIEDTAEVLRKVSSFLRTLTPEEVDDLIAGKVRITLTSRVGRSAYPRRSAIHKLDTDLIRRQLRDKATREDGFAFLESLELTRDSLRAIATALDLPTPKSDTVGKLKDRIIEATIGYRLRSDAIRSRD